MNSYKLCHNLRYKEDIMQCRTWLLYLMLLSSLSNFNNFIVDIVAQEVKSEDDSTARGFFLVSRPLKSATTTNSLPRKAPRLGAKSNKINTNAAAKLGIGYTIYWRNSTGQAERVDPSHEFQAGDAVRITIETNATGYLYIFHSENDQHPTMLFPDARLADGANRITAHVPYEVPSSKDANEARRWFVFDERAATERIYLVFSENPLPQIPQGKELVTLCQTLECPWQPPIPLWEDLKQQARKPLVTSISRSIGQAQSSQEQDAISRGLSLPKEAPTPSVVKISQTKEAKVLVTSIDLVHK
jgi:Domain of unknown function (DUF4384)